MGEVAAIWIKRFKRGPMDAAEAAQLVAGRGIVGNANQGGKRQVTIIDEAAWQRAAEAVGETINPSTRRANVMLRGVDLEKSRGRILQLGECRIRIYGETRPCEQMEEAVSGLRAAMSPEWRGGAYGEVLDDGTIRVGDRAEFEDLPLLALLNP
jgi:MOSC domain-containing protein YiiM